MSEDGVPPIDWVPPEVYADGAFCKKYEIERGLGIGGAGIVVCARHRELDERVAIKFLLPGPENPDAIARFRREARAANRVRDEHVIRIIDVATTETGVPYVVMEYLEGVDLERMLLQTPDRQLPVRDAIEFVLQACEALAECHGVGIIHRDLKPSNLFCTHGADGLPFIKVLDFGISKLGPATTDGAMTGKHAIIGSPRYMSPEQFSAPSEVDQRTDIWALGVILYELVTGTSPFVGNTLISIWEKVKADVPRPIHELRRDAPSTLSPVVMRCLEKDPARRYQTVAEFAKAVLPLAPERSRGSVARIVRIVEAPGVTTASLSLPASGRATPVQSAASLSVRPKSANPRGSTGLVIAALLALCVLAGMAIRQALTDPKKAPTSAETAAHRATTPAVTAPPTVKKAPSVPHSQAAAALPSATSIPALAPSTAPARGAAPARTTTARVVSAGRPNRPALPPSEPAPAAANGAGVAVFPVVPAERSGAAPTGARDKPKGAPFVVDIVEQRKPLGAPP